MKMNNKFNNKKVDMFYSYGLKNTKGARGPVVLQRF